MPDNEKFKVIEKQFRGFDKTMVEVGYRYNGLYWAGEDKNWELTSYHIEKIMHTLDLGVERRPERKENAQVLSLFFLSLKPLLKTKIRRVFGSSLKSLDKRVMPVIRLKMFLISMSLSRKSG